MARKRNQGKTGNQFSAYANHTVDLRAADAVIQITVFLKVPKVCFRKTELCVGESFRSGPVVQVIVRAVDVSHFFRTDTGLVVKFFHQELRGERWINEDHSIFTPNGSASGDAGMNSLAAAFAPEYVSGEMADGDQIPFIFHISPILPQAL